MEKLLKNQKKLNWIKNQFFVLKENKKKWKKANEIKKLFDFEKAAKLAENPTFLWSKNDWKYYKRIGKKLERIEKNKE